jgi:hypothetical protein
MPIMISMAYAHKSKCGDFMYEVLKKSINGTQLLNTRSVNYINLKK